MLQLINKVYFPRFINKKNIHIFDLNRSFYSQKSIDNDAVINDKKKKLGQKERIKNKILNNQTNIRFYTVYGSIGYVYIKICKWSTDTIHILQDMDLIEGNLLDLVYYIGVFHTLLGIYSLYIAKKLTSSVGRPSQGVIHEILLQLKTNEKIKELFPNSIEIGYLSTISIIDGNVRLFDDKKAYLYRKWLNELKDKPIESIYSTPLPYRFDLIVKWLDGNISFRKIFSKKPTMKYDSKKFTKYNNTYFGWTRYWKPTSIQMVLHVREINNDNNHGILLVQVEKHQTGLSNIVGSSGYTNFNILQLLRLHDGSIINLLDNLSNSESIEPVILKNEQLIKLFDTIPTQTPPEPDIPHIPTIKLDSK